MGKTIVHIKAHYDELSRAERKVADFLIDNPDDILPLYITELADRCGASEATIVRFAKKLGFDGYQQLKIAVAKESHARPINENITAKDEPYDVFTKVCEDLSRRPRARLTDPHLPSAVRQYSHPTAFLS